jgi:hypothetical protein
MRHPLPGNPITVSSASHHDLHRPQAAWWTHAETCALTSLMMVFADVPRCGSPQPGNGSIKLITLSGVAVVDGVFLNGHGPYRFLLDTGSGGNLVDTSIAQTLALIPIFGRA